MRPVSGRTSGVEGGIRSRPQPRIALHPDAPAARGYEDLPMRLMACGRRVGVRCDHCGASTAEIGEPPRQALTELPAA